MSFLYLSYPDVLFNLFCLIFFIHISYPLSFCFLSQFSNDDYLFMWGDGRCTVKGHTVSLLCTLSPCYIHSANFFWSSLPTPGLHILKLSALPVFSRRLWWLLFTILWELFLSSLGFLSFSSSSSPLSHYSSLPLIPPFSPLSNEDCFTKRERIAKVS